MNKFLTMNCVEDVDTAAVVVMFSTEVVVAIGTSVEFGSSVVVSDDEFVLFTKVVVVVVSFTFVVVRGAVVVEGIVVRGAVVDVFVVD